MGINWAEHALEIEAPIEDCFDAIVDYESFPGWQSAVTSIEVLSRDGAGLGRRVHLHISTKGQRIDYVLDYSYERPERILWDFVEGHGVDDVDGTYTFEDLGGGRTRAAYRLGIDPSLPVPGVIARRIHRGAVRTSVEELKEEAERRHASASGAPARPADREVEEPVPEQPVAEEPAPEQPGDGERAAREPGGTPEEAAPEPAAPSGRAEDPLGRAVSLGEDLAREAVRAGLEVAGLAVGVAREVAVKSIELGMGAAGELKDRLSCLLGRER